jgi:hypothetical protein
MSIASSTILYACYKEFRGKYDTTTEWCSTRYVPYDEPCDVEHADGIVAAVHVLDESYDANSFKGNSVRGAGWLS